MTDYKKLYILMVNASERAIEEIEGQNYGAAREILIAAEQECEEIYISAREGLKTQKPPEADGKN